MFPIRTKGFTVSSTTPDAREGSHKVQIIGGLLVIVFTFALVGVMILLEGVGLSLAILGTFILALGLGGRIVLLLGKLHPIAEASVARCCYVAAALGALCFEPWGTRIWVAAVALSVMVLLDYLEYRAKGHRTT